MGMYILDYFFRAPVTLPNTAKPAFPDPFFLGDSGSKDTFFYRMQNLYNLGERFIRNSSQFFKYHFLIIFCFCLHNSSCETRGHIFIYQLISPQPQLSWLASEQADTLLQSIPYLQPPPLSLAPLFPFPKNRTPLFFSAKNDMSVPPSLLSLPVSDCTYM